MRSPRTIALTAVVAAALPAGAALAAAPSQARATAAGPSAATHASARSLPRGWAATATRAMDLGLAPTGRVPGRRVLHVSVGLALRHQRAMDRLATAVSTPGSRARRHLLP